MAGNGYEKSGVSCFARYFWCALFIFSVFAVIPAHGASEQEEKKYYDTKPQPLKIPSDPISTLRSFGHAPNAVTGMERLDPFRELVPPPAPSEIVRYKDIKSEYNEMRPIWDGIESDIAKYVESVGTCLKGGGTPQPDSRKFGEYMIANYSSTDGRNIINLVPYFITCEAIKARNVNYCSNDTFMVSLNSPKNNSPDSAEGLCPMFYFLWKVIANISEAEHPMDDYEISLLCNQGVEEPFKATKEQCVETLKALASYAHDGNPEVCEKMGIESLKSICRAGVTGQNSYCGDISGGSAACMTGACGVVTDIVKGIRAETKDKNLDATIAKSHKDELEKCHNDNKETGSRPILWYPMLMSYIYMNTGRTDECYDVFYAEDKATYCEFFGDEILKENIIPDVLKYQKIQPVFENKFRNDIEIEEKRRISRENEEAVKDVSSK